MRFQLIRADENLHRLPGFDVIEYRVVTNFGEFKAVAMAASRLERDRPDSRIWSVELAAVQDQWEPDPRDLVDYWSVA